MSPALGTRSIPLTKSQCSGFWSLRAVLVPAGGSGSLNFLELVSISEEFFMLIMRSRSFFLAFLRAMLAMSMALLWAAFFLIGFTGTCSVGGYANRANRLHAFLDFTWFNLGSLGFRAICTLASRRAFSMTMALTILLTQPLVQQSAIEGVFISGFLYIPLRLSFSAPASALFQAHVQVHLLHPPFRHLSLT